jgi:gluconate 2-dehydrogenase gamma chain
MKSRNREAAHAIIHVVRSIRRARGALGPVLRLPGDGRAASGRAAPSRGIAASHLSFLNSGETSMTSNDAFDGRRRFLRGALAAVPGTLMLAAEPGLFPDAAAAEALPRDDYRPTFFTESEWAFVKAATDRLIPSNEHGPGALDLHVPEFIDRQMETEYGFGGLWYLQGPFHPDADFALGYQLRFSPRELYRVAIAEVNGWCRQVHGKDFADLGEADQDKALELLQLNEVGLPNVKAAEFFLQLLANTKEGYFADPMYGGNRNMGSWKMIGFPGARADFADLLDKPGKVYPLGPVSIRGEKG